MGKFDVIATPQSGRNLDKSVVEQVHRLHLVSEDLTDFLEELLTSTTSSKMIQYRLLSDFDRPMWEFAVPVNHSIPAGTCTQETHEHERGACGLKHCMVSQMSNQEESLKLSTSSRAKAP